MMVQTGSWHGFSFLFLLCSLHLSPILAYMLKDCTILYPETVTAGVSVDCKNGALISIPEDIPRDVISLTMRGNKIQKIHRTDLYHLSNLTDLNLGFNSITCVDDEAFVALVQLKELRMDNNQLTRLTDNMFLGLSNLLMLRLDLNNIQFISPAAFKSLTSLQELSLWSNQITQIISILKLPRLQVLNIKIQELVSFQSKDLPLNMSSELRELRIASQSIKKFSITTAVFPHLETIDMSQCCNPIGWEWDIPDRYSLRNITMVHLTGSMSFNTIRKSLQSLVSLEFLDLTYVEKAINRGILHIACQIPTMRKLRFFMSFNHIANIGEKLSPCTQLTYLDLSHNNLYELSNGSIKQMNQLSYLKVAWNYLSKVPDDVKNLYMLQTLKLNDNNICHLSCSDFFNLTRLQILDLAHNHILELKPCVFQHLNELQYLSLSYNSILMIGEPFKTGLQKLEYLDLNNNVFSVLSQGAFASLKSLRRVNMELGLWSFEWDNHYLEGLDELETLSLLFYLNPNGVIYSPPCELLKSLKRFTIQFSPQTYEQEQPKYEILSVMLSDMKHLEHLTAVNVYSQPESVFNTFKYVPQLKTLTLTGNNLQYPKPETFDPIQNLEALRFSKNNLKSLHFLAQANLTRLSWLDLSQNELTVINVSVFRSLPALRYVYLGQNPFACDCSNYDFHQWMLNNNQTLVVFAHSYMCGYPLTKKGTRFLDFDYHSCELGDASFICFISSTCAIVLTLLTCFTYHFLRLHLLYAYYLFLAFLYDANKRKRGSPEHYDAFISYNVHDELWVCREMLPVLEGEQGWRLCLHHRDFLPGKPIIENITDAIYGSRKTICVISHHYLESEWCSREIQMASYRLFDEQKDVLILVFLEDIPAHQLSPYYQIRRLVKRDTYLSWSQAGRHPGLFWQNLSRALDTPHTDLGLNE